MSNLKYSNRNKKNFYGINETNYPKNPDNTLIYAHQLEGLLREIIDNDPTLFFRETLYAYGDEKGNEKKILIGVEVLPIFIVLPTMGDRIVCWQELFETNKKTEARFFVPMFFTGDLRKSFIDAIAVYRWEICRNLTGSLWKDPVEGGIAGAYSDYINYYKQNRSLSLEAKKKLEKFIRENRKNQRKMFCQNYYDWIENERVGLMRFSQYLRGIFFKHIPFGKAIRSELKKIPSFEKLISVFEIRMKKKKRVLTNKYNKFLKNENNVSDLLNKHINSFDR